MRVSYTASTRTFDWKHPRDLEILPFQTRKRSCAESGEGDGFGLKLGISFLPQLPLSASRCSRSLDTSSFWIRGLLNMDEAVPHMNGEATFMNGAARDRASLQPSVKVAKNAAEIASKVSAESKGTRSHKPLTLYRVIRGIVCLIILLSTAFVTLIILGPIAFIGLRLYSVHMSRMWIGYIFGHWLSLWPYLFEEINGTKVVFSGDDVPSAERAMVMCNHRTEVDWMYIWNLALRKKQIGFTKYALKSSVRNVPLFGWAFHVLEFLPLDRKWELDAPVIESYLRSFGDPVDPFWFVLFPEGTDFTEEKLAKGNVYAKQLGLPGELHHVLLPRTKGFTACLPLLADSVIAVYDLTMAYKFRCPLFIDNLFGIDPAEVHIHVRRIPIKEIPTSEEEASSWLYDSFYKKDQLLAEFYKEGSFPNVIDQGELNTPGFLIRLVVFTVSSLLVLRFALFQYWWLRVYVAFSCIVLPTLTFFSIKPTPFANSR